MGELINKSKLHIYIGSVLVCFGKLEIGIWKEQVGTNICEGTNIFRSSSSILVL